MDQSLVEFERAFADQIREERRQATHVQAKTAHRAKQREVQSVNRQGTVRFALLVLMLLVTAVVVTLLMFKVLYLVLG